jgi:hypothetical protein
VNVEPVAGDIPHPELCGATWQALVQERAHLTDENFFDAAPS